MDAEIKNEIIENDDIAECEEQLPEEEQVHYRDSTYEIISKIAYLIGVPKKIFEKEGLSPKINVYESLEKEKNARIIRHLCIIRNSIERGFKNINNKIKFEFKSILSMPEHIPQESIKQLSEDGISFYKNSNKQLNQHIIEINKIISDRINNCKSLFPVWLNWQYVKQLFVMPNGTTEAGTSAAANLFYSKMNLYPYKMYINWKPKECGNILYNDKKFVTLLYEWNNDVFLDYSKVSDASGFVKGTIYDFIENSEKVVVVVDCENSDPVKLSATLKNLDSAYTQKIFSIILVDDVHTSSTWDIFENYTEIPVEHIMTERVKADKSLVDIKLAVRVSKEYYENKVDAFVIVSSDSDFWGLIESLEKARFLVMIERDQCGPDLKKALAREGIFYCYIDDFYSGMAEDVKQDSIFKAMKQYIKDNVKLNINEMFFKALVETRVEMDGTEKKQFFEKYVKTVKMQIDANGDVQFVFNTYR